MHLLAGFVFESSMRLSLQMTHPPIRPVPSTVETAAMGPVGLQQVRESASLVYDIEWREKSHYVGYWPIYHTLKKWMATPFSCVISVREKTRGKLVASACLGPAFEYGKPKTQQPPSAHISHVFIDAKARALMLGPWLIRELVAQAERMGYQAVTADSSVNSVQQFLRRLGFETTGYGRWNKEWFRLALPSKSKKEAPAA